MAKNQVYDQGTDVSLPVTAEVRSGDPVRVNALNGVAMTDVSTANAAGILVSPTSGIVSSNGAGFASVRIGRGTFRHPVTLTAARGFGYPIYAVPAAAGSKQTLSDTNTGKLFGYLEEAGAIGTSNLAVKTGPPVV